MREYTKTTEQLIEKLKRIFGNKYDYSLVDYKNMNTKVKIICRKCENVFKQQPRNHIYNRNGCPVCRNGKEKDISNIEKIEK